MRIFHKRSVFASFFCVVLLTWWSLPGLAGAATRNTIPSDEPAKVRLRIRAHADYDFRRQTVDWRKEVREVVQAAAERFEVVGVELDLVDLRAWERSSAPKLEEDLKVLARLDDGEGVDVVLGFVAADPVFSNDVHSLGMAIPFSRYAVVRNIRASVSREAIAVRAMPWTSSASIDDTVAGRYRHRKGSVLAHEIGHTLGAHHTHDRFRVMHPIYDHRQHGFSREAVELFSCALTHRNRASDEDYVAWYQDAIAHIERRKQWGSLSGDERDTIELLSERIAMLSREDDDAVSASNGEPNSSGLSESAAGAPPTSPLPLVPAPDRWAALSEPDRVSLHRVFAAFEAGQHDAAWEQLFALRERYRDVGAMQSLSCQLASRMDHKKARSICELALVVDPSDPIPALEMLASQQHQPRLDKRESEHIKAACSRRTSLKPDAMLFAGQVLLSYGAYSCVASLVERMPADKRPTLDAQLREARGRFGVPETVSSLDEEIQWRQSSHRIERYLSAGRFDEAKKEAQRAADAFTFSGPRTALCESVARSKRYREAKPHCEAAIAGEGFDAYAHYILAVIEARQNHLKKAEALLRRAVEETPGFDEAWTLLAQVVTHRGGKKDLITLRERYRLLHGSQPEF